MENDQVTLPMVCICEVDDHQEAEENRLEVQRRLGCPAPALSMGVVFSLVWDFGVEVGVSSDMWSRVTVSSPDFQGQVDCDLPLDGFCALWLALALHFPDRVPAPAAPVASGTAESVQLLGSLERIEEAWEAHTEECVPCTEGKGYQCPTGTDMIHKSIHAKDRIIDRWGVPHPQSSPAWWGVEKS